MGFRRLAALGLALLLALGMSACFFSSNSDEEDGGDESQAGDFNPDQDENAEYPVRIGAVEVDTRPLKVVSLSPALTEKLMDLGFSDRVLGVNDGYQAPDSLSALPSYGTPQYPDVAALRDLAPHVVFTSAEPEDNVRAQLEEMGTAVVVLSRADSLAELEELYVTVATVMEGKHTGTLIGQTFVTQHLRPRLDALPAVGGGAPAIYLCELNFTVATGDFLESELLERLGYTNIAAAQTDFYYQGAETEEGRAAFASVDVIFMDHAITITHLEQNDYYKGLNATLKDRFVNLDAQVIECQGLRMVAELERVVTELRTKDLV